MTLAFGWEPIARARADGLDDMIALDWEELEHHKDTSPFDPNWPTYLRLERDGVYRLAVLRKNGVMVGYNGFFIQPPLHSRSTLWAVNDLVYVDPDHRGLAGVKMLRQTEHMLRELGVRIVMYASKPHDLSGKRGRDSVGQLFEKLGYEPFDQSWTKVL